MYKPYDHQVNGIEIGKKGSHAFFWDCGTGKSLLGLSLIKHFKSIGIGPVIVSCPLSIIEAAWINDCKKFTPELSIVSLWSKKPAEPKKRLAEDYDIYVGNPEKIKSLHPQIVKKKPMVIFVDESSGMKNPKTQYTQSLLTFAGINSRGSKYKSDWVIPFRYVLSGTPAPNDHSEYWAQIKFITGPGGKAFNDLFYGFRNHFFNYFQLPNSKKRIYTFIKSMETEFMDRMKPFCDVVRKEDVADLPEQVHEIREIHLGKEEQKAYDTLKKDLVLQFGDEDVLASTALTEILKLRQLTSGFVYGEQGTHQIGKSKLNELKALVEEIGKHQIIVWANFKYEIRSILELFAKMGIKAEGVWSETKDRNKVIKDFQENAIQIIVANPMSAAHGLSFDNCKYNIDFSMNYSYELFKQSRDRTHGMNRGVKGQSTTYYYFLAYKTIDEVIYKIVAKKGDMSTGILNYLKK